MWMASPGPKLDNATWGRGYAVSMQNRTGSNHEKFGGAFCGFESIESWNLQDVNPIKMGKVGCANPLRTRFYKG